jgi:hypothetical protein
MNLPLNRRRFQTAVVTGAAALAFPCARAADRMALFDAHIHYSHDAWELVPPKQAVQILREAGLRGAFVSSSNDDGTQRLVAEAPDLIVPELRPYRTRNEIGTWFRDDTVLRYLEERLAKYRYAGIGEFHLYGENADLPLPRRMVALARQHGLLLHAHSDVDAIERLLRQWPEARVLWAHSGFDRPETVREVLRRHPRLWSDLAFRGDQANGSKVDPAWREAFDEFPERFVIGTDTFTPERWHYIGSHADYSRGWLADLPEPLASNIGWRNAETLLRGSKAKAARAPRDRCGLSSPAQPLRRSRGRPARRLGAATTCRRRRACSSNSAARRSRSRRGRRRSRSAATSRSTSSSARPKARGRARSPASMPRCRCIATA